MSDAQRDPHLLVSARIHRHPKLIELSNDAARWGWLTVMAEAKLQRPAGTFASMRVLRVIAGRYARYIPEWLKQGLLERDGDMLRVHDWSAHQERSRTQAWRLENGLTSGHGNLGGNNGETDGETSGETNGNPLARASALSQSHSQSKTTEGGPGGTDDRADLEAWLLVKFRPPTENQRRFLDGYVRTFDVTGPRRAERIILSNPADPIAALKADLDAFRGERAEAAKAAEAESAAAHSSKAVIATKVKVHNLGGHTEPDPRCPECAA